MLKDSTSIFSTFKLSGKGKALHSGLHLDSGILVRLVTNLAVYKIKIMAGAIPL